MLDGSNDEESRSDVCTEMKKVSEYSRNLPSQRFATPPHGDKGDHGNADEVDADRASDEEVQQSLICGSG